MVNNVLSCADVIAFDLAGERDEAGPFDLKAKPLSLSAGLIVDFVLSNLVNSGIYKVKVLTQFKSESLNRHLKKGWFISPILDQYIDPVPAQMRTGKSWYMGSADAVYQNKNLLNDSHADTVGVFGADHVYRMDIRQMLAFHAKSRADVTVAAIPYSIKEAHAFGVIGVDKNSRMIDFKEKPKKPMPMPTDKTKALVSMGIYLFRADLLKEAIIRDAAENHRDSGETSSRQSTRRLRDGHDFSGTHAQDDRAERGYWRAQTR